MRCFGGWARSVGIVLVSMALNVVLACAAFAGPGAPHPAAPGPDRAVQATGDWLPTIAFFGILLASGLLMVGWARLRDRTRGPYTAQRATDGIG